MNQELNLLPIPGFLEFWIFGFFGFCGLLESEAEVPESGILAFGLFANFVLSNFVLVHFVLCFRTLCLGTHNRILHFLNF